jgi:predicted nuclease of predicted toxin-antitoxin system
MLLLVADENFNNRIIRGLFRRKKDLDIIRVQDIGLSTQNDPVILEWAAQHNRILLTHDVTKITDFAYERIAIGQAMPGIFAVHRTAPLGRVIEDILLLVEGSFENEWINQIVYIPLG